MNRNRTTIIPLLLAVAGAAGCSATVAAPMGEPDAAAPEPDAPPPPPPPEELPPPIECENPPPQLMIVLDRSGSFVRRPDGSLPPNTDEGKTETRWHIMLEAIRGVTAILQADVQFGLTLFPHDPEGTDGYDCSNLDTWMTEYLPPETNDLSCQPGEVKVSPSMMNGAVMDAALDRDNTGLCSTTPIGSGLAAAHADLDSIATDEYAQAAILITDGADNCDDNEGYPTQSLTTADAMAAAGIRVYVLGFSGSGEDFNPVHLNNLACAGGTAPDFDNNCVLDGDGYRAVEAPNPERLYHLAAELDSLTGALSNIAEDACNDPKIDLRRVR